MKKLINPFVYLAGGRSLLIGLAGICISALLAWLSNTHFDGLFDIHYSSERAYHIHLFAGLFHWLVLSFTLGIAAVLLSRTRFRWLDLLGTLSMARLPFIITVIIPFIIEPTDISDYFLKGEALDAGQIIGMGISFLISLLAIVWALTWTYQAYTLVANLSGSKAVISFILAMIAAAILDKVLMSVVLGYTLFPGLTP